MVKYTNPIFRLTNHFRQRVYERIFQEDWKGQSLRDREIKEMFNNSKELLGWQNDQSMVEYFRSRYNSTKFRIFKYGKFVFVCKRHDTITNLYLMLTTFEPTSMRFSTKK